MNYNDVKLIELVKHCPTVYDSKIAEFKIPHRKEEAWEIISKEMEITGERSFVLFNKQQNTNNQPNPRIPKKKTKKFHSSTRMSKPLAHDTRKIRAGTKTAR